MLLNWAQIAENFKNITNPKSPVLTDIVDGKVIILTTKSVICFEVTKSPVSQKQHKFCRFFFVFTVW